MNPDLLKLLNPDGRTTQERVNADLAKRRRIDRANRLAAEAASVCDMRSDGGPPRRRSIKG